MGPLVYVLSALTSLLCAILLLSGYNRARRSLLLWSGLCFAGLTLSNVLLFVDLVIVPHRDLFTWRLGTAIVAMALLLWGLINERR
jgi:hypothetical protein